MRVTCVTVHVKPESVADFIQATVENHRCSVKEPGNMRFDILQSEEDPARFTLYEAYESDEAAAAHKDTAHYKQWRKTVAGWTAGPREGIAHRVIEPADRSKW